MRRQWWIVGGLVAVIVALIGVGWLARDRFLPLDVGDPAPEFTATDLEGRPVSLDDLRGQVVLLNIWATWCEPCREEMPAMERLYRALGPEGLRVVAVSIDVAPGALDRSGNPGGDVAAFAREMGLTFDIWHDPSGEISRTYRTTGVPESFVIDTTGLIVTKVIGAHEWDAPTRIDYFRRLLGR